MDKREQIKEYFKPFPTWAVWAIGIGVGFLLLSGGGAGPIMIGLVLIGVGIWILVDSNKKKPNDAQMDAWLEEDLKTLHDKALSKSGTDVSELVGEPVMITGPRFWDIGGAGWKFKKGKDNILRFSPVDVTVLNFTPNQLISYSAAFDITTGNSLNEGTDEYFYRDVVSVSTKTQSITRQGAGPAGGNFSGTQQLNASETFVLTTSGGTSIEVVLSGPGLIQKMGGGSIPTTRADKAIQAVRKMLREKKGTPA